MRRIYQTVLAGRHEEGKNLMSVAGNCAKISRNSSSEFSCNSEISTFEFAISFHFHDRITVDIKYIILTPVDLKLQPDRFKAGT